MRKNRTGCVFLHSVLLYLCGFTVHYAHFSFICAERLSTCRPWELCIFITRNVGLCRDINVLVFTYSTYLYKDIHRSTGKNGKFYRKLSDLFSQAGCNFTKRLLHRVEIGMGIYIQRYTDIRMTHQILQTLHINAALLHIRAECMP